MARLSFVAAVLFVLLLSACNFLGSKEMRNAETYIQINELGKAKQLLDLELQTNPKNVRARVMLAKVYLLMPNPQEAHAEFDKALLLDAGAKSEIAKTYFEAAQSIETRNGSAASATFISTYLQEAATRDPDLKGKIVDWAIKRAKTESSAEPHAAGPVALVRAAAKTAPESRDRISDALMEIAKTSLNKQFLPQAAVYAMEAGQQSPSKQNEATTVMRSACTMLPSADQEFARDCLQKAVQWNPALANDDDVSWSITVGLTSNPGTGPADYLAKFPNGKHAAEAKSIQAEKAATAEQAAKARDNAAEQAAKAKADLAYMTRDCDGAGDGRPGAVYRDLSQQKIDRFTIDLHPGCFSGYILLPQSWEYYRMEAAGPMDNWWLAYKWYQSKNSASGQNPPLKANQLTTMRHGSHKIRVQGHGQLLFYPIP